MAQIMPRPVPSSSILPKPSATPPWPMMAQAMPTPEPTPAPTPAAPSPFAVAEPPAMPQIEDLPKALDGSNPSLPKLEQVGPQEYRLNYHGMSKEDEQSFKDSMAEGERIGAAAIAAQQGDVDSLRATMRQYEGSPNKLDLTPLLGLVDTWTGSKLASHYKRPETPEEKLMNLVNAKKGVVVAQSGITDAQLALIKNQLGNKEKLLQMKQEEELMKLRFAERNDRKKAFDDLKGEKFDVDVNEKYRKAYGDQVAGMSDFVRHAQSIKDIVARHGGIPLSGPDKAAYDSAVAQASVVYNRDIAKLGALAGGDLNLIEKSLANNNSLAGFFNEKFKGGAAGNIGVIDRLIKGADNKVKDIGKLATATYGERGTAVHKQFEDVYKSNRSSKVSDQTEDAQALKWANEHPDDPRAAQILQLHGVQ